MSASTKSLHRSYPSKTEVEKKFKDLILKINELNITVIKNRNSLDTAQRLLVRDTKDLKVWNEDINNLLGRRCVDLKMYIDYKQLIAETKNKVSFGNQKVSEFKSLLTEQEKQLKEMQHSADELTKQIAQYGKVVPIWV